MMMFAVLTFITNNHIHTTHAAEGTATTNEVKTNDDANTNEVLLYAELSLTQKVLGKQKRVIKSLSWKTEAEAAKEATKDDWLPVVFPLPIRTFYSKFF